MSPMTDGLPELFRMTEADVQNLDKDKCPKCEASITWVPFSDTVGVRATCSNCGLEITCAPSDGQIVKDRGLDVTDDEYKRLDESEW